MQSPLQRLYKTKFALVAVVATVVGTALLLAAGWPSWQVAVNLVGGALATAGLIGVWFQYIGNEDAGQEAERQFRKAIRDEAPAIRDSVVDAMAFTPEKIFNVTASEVVDAIVENSLAKQLGSHELAADVYADLKAQVLRSTEQWRNLRISIGLSPWKRAKQPAKSMFVATFHYDYRASNMNSVLRFASVSDRAEYRELQRDSSYTEVWYVGAKSGLDGASPDAFQLVDVAVNGKQQRIRRSTRPGAQVYSVRLEPERGRASDESTVSFTYRGLVLQRGHLLYIDLIKPTKGLTVNLSYGGAGISYVSVADYIAAAMQPNISQLPAVDPNPSVSLTFDGWVLPKGGIAFVWTLDDEVSAR